MSNPASITEMYSDITAICPLCQDAVIAKPVAQQEVAGETQVRGLECTRCGYGIDLSLAWTPRWWHGLGK